jgi:osmoprotectant transport system permease protein
MPIIAQGGGFVRDRTGQSSCVADDGFCPDWIWNNFDRYVSPTWEHLYLTLISVGLGFAIAVVLAGSWDRSPG